MTGDYATEDQAVRRVEALKRAGRWPGIIRHPDGSVHDRAACGLCPPPVVPVPLDAAPEITAAMRETRTIRDGYARLCEEFGPAWQTGQGARISLTVLNRHREAAGLPALKPREAQGKPDMWDRQAAEIEQMELERDEARQQLAKALAANQRWADTLGDIQQAARERDAARFAGHEMLNHISSCYGCADHGKVIRWTEALGDGG